MTQIDYYLSTISPYAYLAGDRLEKIAGRHGARVTYRPLDIMQLFDRTGGVRPAARHPSRMDYRSQELARWSAHLGIAVSETDVAALMTLFKLARLKANPTNPENWVDGCGYLACGGEIAAQQARSATERAATAPQADPTLNDTRQPTPGLYEAPTRLCRGYERTPE